MIYINLSVMVDYIRKLKQITFVNIIILTFVTYKVYIINHSFFRYERPIITINAA